MSVQDTPDILDRLAGVVPGSALDALRRERPQTRDNVQASYAALFEAPDETGVTPGERLAVAGFVALLHGGVPAATHYLDRLEAQPDGAKLAAAIRQQAELATAKGPYGAYPPGPLSREDVAGPVFTVGEAGRAALGERLSAALAHVHLLVLHPRDAAASDLAALQKAGWSTAAIVTLSQLVAYLSFQIRAAHGLRVLAA
jgi:CMD domain protein